MPHPIKGQGIYAFVTLMVDIDGNDSLIDELKSMVAKEISPIAKPDLIQWAPGLPKTRSGKLCEEYFVNLLKVILKILEM